MTCHAPRRAGPLLGGSPPNRTMAQDEGGGNTHTCAAETEFNPQKGADVSATSRGRHDQMRRSLVWIVSLSLVATIGGGISIAMASDEDTRWT